VKSLRIGFDMDGVLADFAGAYREIEDRLFGPAADSRPGGPAEEAEAEHKGLPAQEGDGSPEDPEIAAEDRVRDAKGLRRRRDLVWQEIKSTPDFWLTLKPTEEDAVRRIHALMIQHRWEVFFITQRPATSGDTVQRQTQRWLVAQGFDLPSVLVINGPRGSAAGALRLDYHVDDSAQNCIDVKSESSAKPLLICERDDETTRLSARRLGIGSASTIGECLDILEEATRSHAQPKLLDKLATLVGWR
jgi:hypothetical protein